MKKSRYYLIIHKPLNVKRALSQRADRKGSQMKYPKLFRSCLLGGLIACVMVFSCEMEKQPGQQTWPQCRRSRCIPLKKEIISWAKLLLRPKKNGKTVDPRTVPYTSGKGHWTGLLRKIRPDHEHGIYRCAGCGLDLFGLRTNSIPAPAGRVLLPHRCLRTLSPDLTIPFYAPHRCALPPLRRPYRPRFWRRSQANRAALLHEFRGPAIRGNKEISFWEANQWKILISGLMGLSTIIISATALRAVNFEKATFCRRMFLVHGASLW